MAIVDARGDPPPVEAIEAAATILRASGIAGVPTDTVYGLAADPFRAGATDRLFKLKRRPRTFELPVLVADVDQALTLATTVPAAAERLMARFWPGALTVVLPRRPDLDADLGSDEATIGLRCPDHPVPLALCRALGPIATTSANRHGDAPATTAAELASMFGSGVAIVLDGGPCSGDPSTVVDCTGAEPRLLRAGRLPWDEIRAATAQTPVVDRDDELFAIVDREQERQRSTLQLIASENFTSRQVREATGSVLTNKYAEGYPGKRYYGGNLVIDEVEDLARRRCCQLFGAEHANVQPHAGANANVAAYLALLKPGDTVLGMRLDQGGHLTHGSPVNVSGQFYHFVAYGVTASDERIDLEQLEALAREHRPKLIVAGATAYPRIIDPAPIRRIADDVGALFLFDAAHVAGLIAGGVHPNPVGVADVVTFTTHKTLRGPRGGCIVCRPELAKSIDKAVFPGLQGGPLEHVIAAKAVAFWEALQPSFGEYAAQIVANASALAEALAGEGFRMVSGGTDNHLMLVDLQPFDAELTGKRAQEALDLAGITCNKNTIPNDPRSPFVTSGLRLGTAAMTTTGMAEGEMAVIARYIGRVLRDPDNAAERAAVRDEVANLCGKFSPEF